MIRKFGYSSFEREALRLPLFVYFITVFYRILYLLSYFIRFEIFVLRVCFLRGRKESF